MTSSKNFSAYMFGAVLIVGLPAIIALSRLIAG
jgi:hypothetical protein